MSHVYVVIEFPSLTNTDKCKFYAFFYFYANKNMHNNSTQPTKNEFSLLTESEACLYNTLEAGGSTVISMEQRVLPGQTPLCEL